MTRDNIIDEYFEWLSYLVCGERYSSDISFSKLLMRLHSINFRYSIPMDENREEDGLSLRYRFAIFQGYEDCVDDILDYLEAPCSVLEMMIALAIKCEETIMDDPSIGNRTAQWFWEMIKNLGLGSMYNKRYDKRLVDISVERFLNREYEADGRGGLFVIKDYDRDLRDMEIWHQLLAYLGNIT
jgi:hypothetical protein